MAGAVAGAFLVGVLAAAVALRRAARAKPRPFDATLALIERDARALKP